MDPINYITAVRNPIEAALEGYGARLAQQNAERQMGQQDAALGMQRQGLDLQQQRLGLEQQQFAQLQAAQQQQEAAQAQAIAGQQAFASYIMDPNKTYDKTKAVIDANPELAAQVAEVWSGYSDERKAAETTFTMQFVNAAQSGNTDIATKMLEERVRAAKNSGDQEAVDTYQSYLDMMKAGPEGVNAAIASTMVGLASVLPPEDAMKFADRVFSDGLDLSDQKTIAEIEKTRAETAKIVMETAADPNAMTPEEIVTIEDKIRDDYLKSTGDFVAVQEAYRRVSAAQDGAVGDVALIFGYMKMLDPGSVVREGEFATAQNTAGVPDRIVNLYNKVLDGSRLSDAQIIEFRTQSKALYEAAKTREAEVRRGFALTVEDFGLSSDRVFVGAPPQADTDDAFMDQIDAMIQAGQRPTPEQMARFQAIIAGGQ